MLRKRVSKVIGQEIGEDGWDEVFNEMQTAGRMDMKTATLIILELCKRVEELENGKGKE